MSRLVALTFFFVLLFASAVVGCDKNVDEHGQIKGDVKTLFCKEFDPTSTRGWVITKYKTRKKYPLYRGGFNFTSVDGVEVMNTQCSYKSTSK